MKILFYINSIRHGGAERVLTNLANLFSAEGDSCILVTSFGSTQEYELNSAVIRKNLCDQKMEKNFINRNARLIWCLRSIIKEEKPDIVLSFMAEPNFRMLISSVGLNVKRVISVRNDPKKEYSNIFFKFLAKSLYLFADGIVFQTEDAKRWFPKIIQNKSRIILNQVDSIFYNTVFCGSRKDIVSVGRLVAQKNHKLLIKAYSKIANEVDDNLYIYGDGELRVELEKLIKELKLEERIFLPGIEENIADTIKAAKLFVLSSDYEGMPNALMEAMALGIPVIATDCPCGGPKILLGDINEELLVDIKDVDKLASSMINILSKEEELYYIGLQVKEKAETFSTERIFKEWRTYLIEIMESKKGVRK